MQRRLLITALRLSGKASLYPKCFILDGVKVEESAVTAGHFGEIWKGQFRGQAVCLKVVKVYQRSHINDLLKAFSKEGILWGHLCHENVLPFYGIYHLIDAFGRICLISPWMERGNINEHLKCNPDVNRTLLIQSRESPTFMQRVIHGDLKGANILVTPGGRACIADFGLSTVVDAEILRWTSLESSASIGGTIFTGTNPFYEIVRDPAVMLKVMRGERPSLPAQNSLPCRRWGLTTRVWALMEKCWQQNAAKRPTASAIIERIYKLIRARVAAGGEVAEVPGFTHGVTHSLESISPSKFRNEVHRSIDLRAVDELLCNLISSS
ncbi:kinase-like domain-containing protein [Cyathus striatus]|nr:kinase-like domain-containing protein [Cyathus striatus]